MKEELKKIRKILTIRQRIEFLGISIIIAAQSLLETLAVYLLFPFMYVMMGTSNIEDNDWMLMLKTLFNCDTRSDLLMIMSILLICLYIFKNVISIYIKWIQCRWMASLHKTLMTNSYKYFFYQHYSFFLDADSADVTRAVTDDINRFYEIIKALFDMLQRILVGVFLVITLISISPSFIAVGGAALTIIIFVLNKIISSKINRYGKQGVDILTKSIGWVNQSIGLVKNILINRKQEYYVKKFSEYSGKLYKSRTTYEVISDIPGKIVESLSMAGVFAYIIYLLTRGTNIETMISQFAVFAMALVKILPSIVSINSDVNRIKYHSPAIDSIAGNQVVEDKRCDKDTQNELNSFSECIVLSDVSFKYSDSQEYIYQNINFRINAGDSVAFIGKTGSGKTTLADIMLGLHDPTSGKVLVDGKDISHNRDGWGKLIGYVPQNIYLADASIAENVAFGEENIDFNKVIQCLDDARLLDHVKSLDDGIDTVIGENGVRLSGGQRQRLGIARALYNNPRFLVMDEATSALDSETEEAITESIKRFAHKITILIIAHRTKTIMDCDYIYRVENGKIEEVFDRTSL